MSDPTPEETPIPDWQFAAREEDRIAGAVAAAVAAERERIVKLLRAEATKAGSRRLPLYLIIRDFTDRWIAREGFRDE